jgi:5-(carboxyamino)imidazole ribonucleotide synthase
MIIGVLGGGQLGRMVGLAGVPLGVQFRFLDPEPDSPCAQVGEQLVGSYTDEALLERFLTGLDVVTFEFENVPADTVRAIGRTIPVYPSALALETAQDRLLEKNLFQSLRIPTPPYYPLATRDDLAAGLERTGFPALLKTRRFGYDGKGQWLIRNAEEAASIAVQLPAEPDSLILEGFVHFDREVSLIAVRGRTREVQFYPLVENYHETGILRRSIAPAPNITDDLQHSAQAYAARLLDSLDYVGVLTLEMFLCGDSLLANEIAPRVHNSGHWTIEGARTSQFENHLRAVLGFPLGSTECRGVSAMWNILGSPPTYDDVLAVPGLHLHLYGKEPRSGRKIGHITVCGSDLELIHQQLDVIRALAPQT